MNPLVRAVKANPDFTLDLTFENGEKRVFDMKPYLSIGVFRKLKNFSLFKKVKPLFGSITWPGEQDLSYDTLYLGSKKLNSKKYKLPATRLSSAAEPRVKYKKKKRV